MQLHVLTCCYTCSDGLCNSKDDISLVPSLAAGYLWRCPHTSPEAASSADLVPVSHATGPDFSPFLNQDLSINSDHPKPSSSQVIPCSWQHFIYPILINVIAFRAKACVLLWQLLPIDQPFTVVRSNLWDNPKFTHLSGIFTSILSIKYVIYNIYRPIENKTPSSISLGFLARAITIDSLVHLSIPFTAVYTQLNRV